MKTLKYVCLTAIMLCAGVAGNAQTVKDYFFSDWQDVILYSNEMENLYKSYISRNYVIIEVNGVQGYGGGTLSRNHWRLDIGDDAISIVEYTVESPVTGKNRQGYSNDIWLKIPKGSNEITWMAPQHFGGDWFNVKYTSRFSYVKIDSEIVEALKVTNEIRDLDGKEVIGRHTAYWGKGYGLLYEEDYSFETKKAISYSDRRFNGELNSDEVNDLRAKEKARINAIDSFLSERDKKVYDMDSLDKDTYNDYQKKIYYKIDSVIQYKRNLDLSIVDSVIVKYDGNVSHNISVKGNDADSDNLERQLTECFQDITFSPMSILVADEECVVNTSAKFSFNIKREEKKYLLKKKDDFIKIKEGDKDFYNLYCSEIETFLSCKEQGTHDLSIIKVTTNGNISLRFIYKDEPVTMKPMFMGGDANAFSIWVNQRLVYPAIALENGVQGIVRLKYTIDVDGSVIDVKIDKGVDSSIDNEAVRVLSSSPKWTPGYLFGRPVKVTYNFPVYFQLR